MVVVFLFGGWCCFGGAVGPEGAGGPGGIVSYDRVTEPFGGSTAKGQASVSPFKIKIGQTFDSNAETKTSIADITYSTGRSYLRYNLGYTDSGNYETGTGIKPKGSGRRL